MANYNSMKKDELIKVLKERDAEIDCLTKNKKQLETGIEDYKSQVEILTNDLKKSNDLLTTTVKNNEKLFKDKQELNTLVECKENTINIFNRHRIILAIVAVIAILFAIFM